MDAGFEFLRGCLCRRRADEAKARERLEAARAEAAKITAEPEADLVEAKAERELAEEKLRRAAIENYEWTGDKHPVEGVSVVLNTVLHYGEQEALGWAKEHDVALVLDHRQFGKVVKSLAGSDPSLAFVTVEQEPAVRIARDLKPLAGEAE